MGKRSKSQQPKAGRLSTGRSWVDEDASLSHAAPEEAPAQPCPPCTPSKKKTPKSRTSKAAAAAATTTDAATLSTALAAAKEGEKRMRKEAKRSAEAAAVMGRRLQEAVAAHSGADAEGLRAAAEALRAELRAAKVRETELVSEREVAQQDLATLAAERDNAQAAQQDAASQVRTLEKEAKAKAKRAKELSREVTRLEAELEEAQACGAELRGRDEQAGRTSAHMASKLNEEAQRATELEAALQEAGEVEVALKGQVDVLQARVNELEPTEDALSVLREEHSQVCKERDTAKAELAELAEANAGLTSSLEEAREGLAAAEASGAKALDTTHRLREEKKSGAAKDRRIEALKADLGGARDMLERVAQEKADRDARIAEMEQQLAEHRQEQAAEAKSAARKRKQESVPQEDPEEVFCSRMGRARSLLSVETPCREVPHDMLENVSAAGDSTVPCESQAGTPRAQVTAPVQAAHHRAASEPSIRPARQQMGRRLSTGRLSVPTVVTPKQNTAPAIYAQEATREDKEKYKAALDEQVSAKRARRAVSGRLSGGDYFRFGAAGSGAPIRDNNNEVVTNVTFTRSTNYLPVDHPMSAKKPKRARHF